MCMWVHGVCRGAPAGSTKARLLCERWPLASDAQRQARVTLQDWRGLQPPPKCRSPSKWYPVAGLHSSPLSSVHAHDKVVEMAKS